MSVDFSKSHEAMDVDEHQRTYGGFIRITIICTVVTLVVLALMALLLV